MLPDALRSAIDPSPDGSGRDGSGVPEVGEPESVSSAIDELQWMASRWAIEQSEDAVDAIVCDEATSVCEEHGMRFPAESERGPRAVRAVQQRRRDRGDEPLTRPFELPATLAEAVSVLRDYARRFTQDRPAFVAERYERAVQGLVHAGLLAPGAHGPSGPERGPDDEGLEVDGDEGR